MTQDIFAILSRLPMLDGQQNIKTPEEQDAAALEYTRSKWPEATAEALHAASADILRARRDEELCGECTGSEKCPMNYHPLVLCAEAMYGATTYTVRSGICMSAAAQQGQKKIDFAILLKASGLTPKQQKQTFETYDSDGMGADVRNAEAQAMRAAKKSESLVLAGKRGTGKSHLAVAVMLEVMQKGTPALFRSVPEMLEDLRSGYEDRTYHAKMKQLKEVPCLVLDDLGKERNTDSGLEYLFQVLDYRYRNERQTIVTTNASDQNELVSWSKAEYFVPILSRLNEMGVWCTIKEAADYRGKLAGAKKQPPAA